MTITLYGIKTCDTVKKARDWLGGHGKAYEFHDFRLAGLDAATLRGWCAELGWETVLNRQSSTFRALPEEDRKDLDLDKAMALMLAQPTMVKRPVLVTGGKAMVGFKPERYEAALGA